MHFVSITRLRIRKWQFLPTFFYFTFLSLIQSRRAPGNLGTKLERDAHLVFWTITVWNDEAAMRAFRNRGVHLRAMPKLREWCDEATYVHWQQASPELPELSTSYQRMVSDGIVSKVKYPSPEHASRKFPPPKD